MTRRTATLLLPPAILAAALSLLYAGAKEYDLSLARPGSLEVQLAGKQALVCRSRWHTVDVKSTVSGRFSLSAEDVAVILPGPKPVGATWAVPEQRLAAWGQQLFRATRLTHDNPEAYARWRGSAPQNERVAARGSMTVRLASVEKTREGHVARIQLKGTLDIDTSGTVGNRNGPNSWQSRWHVPLEGTLDFDITQRKIVRFSLASKGSYTGKYFNPGADDADPWEATLTLDLRAGALPSDTEHGLKELIAELGHAEYARRERATQAAAKLPPPALAVLLARLKASDDPELRYRASLIKPKTQPSAPAKRPTTRVLRLEPGFRRR